MEFYIGKISENKDPVDDADEIAEAQKAFGQPQWTQGTIGDGFTEIEGGDEDLPF